jgi:hypothetical protein
VVLPDSDLPTIETIGGIVFPYGWLQLYNHPF